MICSDEDQCTLANPEFWDEHFGPNSLVPGDFLGPIGPPESYEPPNVLTGAGAQTPPNRKRPSVSTDDIIPSDLNIREKK